MKRLKKFLEAADYIEAELENKNIALSFVDKDAIGFLTSLHGENDRLYTFKNNTHAEYFLEEISDLLDGTCEPDDDDDWDIFYAEQLEKASFDIQYYKYRGRVWPTHKVIGFWDYLKADDIKYIVDMLNEKHPELKIDGDWYLHVDDEKNQFIKLKDYSLDMITDEIREKAKEMELLHLLPPEEKRKALMNTGYRAKKSKWKKWQKPFEGADWIETPTKTFDYKDEDAYPFGILFKDFGNKKKNDIIVSNINKINHSKFQEIFNKKGIYVDYGGPLTTYGRVWLNEKVISFWTLRGSIKKCIDDIEYDLKNYGLMKKDESMIDSWFIETNDYDNKNFDFDNKTNKYSGRLIPLKDFNGVIEFDKDKYDLHLLDSGQKKKLMMDNGYRGKTSKWKKYQKPFEHIEHYDNFLIKEYFFEDDEDEDLINKLTPAAEFAELAHSGLTRKGGEPYFIHPETVAKIIHDVKNSDYIAELIIAALLHDTVEDTKVTLEEIKKKFGTLVHSLVEELTSDKDKIKLSGKEEYLTDKMLNISSWALLIKLADRLHNLYDFNDIMSGTDEKRQNWAIKYAKQTKNIIHELEWYRDLSNTQKKLISLIKGKLSDHIHIHFEDEIVFDHDDIDTEIYNNFKPTIENNISNFNNFLLEYFVDDQEKNKKKAKFDYLYNDEDMVIVAIKNFNACKEYGKDTNWCSNYEVAFRFHSQTANMYRVIFKDGYKLRLTWDYIERSAALSKNNFVGGSHWGSGGIVSNTAIEYTFIRPRNNNEPFLFDFNSEENANKIELVRRIEAIPQEAIDAVHDYQEKHSKEKDFNIKKTYEEVRKISIIDIKKINEFQFKITIEYKYKYYKLTIDNYDSDIYVEYPRDFKKVYKFATNDMFSILDKYINDKVKDFKKKNKII